MPTVCPWDSDSRLDSGGYSLFWKMWKTCTVVELWFRHIGKICICFLQSTMPRNSGLVKYKCSQCHRSYAHLHTLRIHEATHRGRYPYWCKVCGKGFPATSNLRGHMAQHTGIAEFKCDICGRQFCYPQDYKRHLKVHSKQSLGDRQLEWGTFTMGGFNRLNILAFCFEISYLLAHDKVVS